VNRACNLDTVAGAVVVLLSAAVAIGATRFPVSTGAVPGPALFPLLLAALWAPLGVVLLVSGWRQQRAMDGEGNASSSRQMVVLLALAVAYALLLPRLGFVSSSALFLTVAVGYLGYRHWWRAGALGLSVAFVVFWLFRVVMKVPLPDGWIG
jgi:putative tricarboxylic transport membrane protein